MGKTDKLEYVQDGYLKPSQVHAQGQRAMFSTPTPTSTSQPEDETLTSTPASSDVDAVWAAYVQDGMVPVEPRYERAELLEPGAVAAALLDAYADHAAEQEARAAIEQPAQLDPPHVDGGVVLRAGPVQPDGTAAAVKVSSPELASLAAKYVRMSDDDFFRRGSREDVIYPSELDDARAMWADVRRLAASVLSQA